jgi:hypothetical protein
MMAVLVAAAAAAATDLTICADRPGKASQTCTVPAGHVQVEVGLTDWTLEKSGGERDTTLALGQFALKYGLDDRSQIELDVAPWQRVTSRVGTVREVASGFGDLLLVYKYRLTEAGSAFQLAASPFVKAPTAKRPIGNREWEGGFVAPMQYAIPNSALTVSMTPEIDWAADADGHGHHALGANVVNLGWQADSKLNLSGEIWGQADWDPAGTIRQWSADAAAAYQPTKRTQLDLGANFGLNRATPDVELYAGVSVLF